MNFENIHIKDFRSMSVEEREKFIYSLLDVRKEEVMQMIAEFEWDSAGTSPNAIFISWRTLSKLPVTLNYFQFGKTRITIIPYEAPDGHFKLSVEDPWGPYQKRFFPGN